MSLKSDNPAPTAEEISQLEAFDRKCQRHDWLFYMSDDHGVYLAGENASAELKREADRGSNAMKRIYNKHHADVFRTKSFWSDLKSYKYPYPEAEEPEKSEFPA